MVFLACTADSTNKSLLQWRASLLKLIFAHKLYYTDDRKLLSKPQLSLICLETIENLLATLIYNNPPESHLTSQPNMAKVPSNYLRSMCALTMYHISVCCIHGQYYMYINLHNSPSHFRVLPNNNRAPFLLPVCEQSEMQYYKRAIYFRIWEYFFNNKSKVKPSLQTALSKEPSIPQHPLHNSNWTYNYYVT